MNIGRTAWGIKKTGGRWWPAISRFMARFVRRQQGQAGPNNGGINHDVSVVRVLQQHLEDPFNTTALAQRVKRLWRLFQLPYSSGSSFQ